MLGEQGRTTDRRIPHALSLTPHTYIYRVVVVSSSFSDDDVVVAVVVVAAAAAAVAWKIRVYKEENNILSLKSPWVLSLR